MEIKERILSIAGSEFAKYGFRKVNTDELAKMIGISKRTIYEHFASKEILFQSIIENKLSEIKSSIDKILENLLTNEQTDFLDSMLEIIELNIESSKLFTREFLQDLDKYALKSHQCMTDFRQIELKNIFDTLYSIGAKRNIIKDKFESELLYLIKYHTFNNIMQPEVISKLSLSTEETVKIIHEVFFTGILTEEARKKYLEKFD